MNFGIFQRLLVILLITSLLPILFVWIINYNANKTTYQEQEYLYMSTNQLAHNIDKWIATYQSILYQTIQLPAIKSMQPQQQTAVLQAVVDQYDIIKQAFTLNTEGQLSAHNADETKKSYADKAFFQKIVQGQATLLQITEQQLLLAQPIKNNKTVGVAVFIIDIAKILPANAIILDKNGKVLFPGTLQNKDYSNHAIYQSKQNTLQEHNKIIAKASTQEDWIVIIEQSARQVFNNTIMLFLLGITILLSLIFAFMASFFIANPVIQFSKTMQKIREAMIDRDYQSLAIFSESKQRKNLIIGIHELFKSFIKEIVLTQRKLTEVVTTQRKLEEIVLKQRELQEINESLEELVVERTKALSVAYQRLKDSQAQLVQSEKMASLGQMVAGVAHEMNTPLGYVKSNVEITQSMIIEAHELMNEYNILFTMISEGEEDEEKVNQQFAKIQSLAKETQQNDVFNELEQIFEDTFHGLNEIAELVGNLKNFSRKDEAKMKDVDVHQCIESTLSIGKNVLKHINIEKQYLEKDMPAIYCAPSQINQVLLNLLTNAAQAIDEKTGKITIKTAFDDKYVKIAIQDNGHGIPKKILTKIFDPFFTTKPVGKGTGLGLSISYKIIQEHGGRIRVSSKEGAGTVFLIELPKHATA